jgi:hypothetical protein
MTGQANSAQHGVRIADPFLDLSHLELTEGLSAEPKAAETHRCPRSLRCG